VTVQLGSAVKIDNPIEAAAEPFCAISSFLFQRLVAGSRAFNLIASKIQVVESVQFNNSNVMHTPNLINRLNLLII
jgi:hypothetical protein